MISEYLPTGAENAVTAKQLCNLLNMNHRELTKAITAERRAGQPICAVVGGFVKGYFLAANKREMELYYRSLSHRLKEIRATATACKKSIKELPE